MKIKLHFTILFLFLFIPMLLTAEWDPIASINLGAKLKEVEKTNEAYLQSLSDTGGAYYTNLGGKECLCNIDTDSEGRIISIDIFFLFESKYQLEEFLPRLLRYVNNYENNSSIKPNIKYSLSSESTRWEYEDHYYLIEYSYDPVPQWFFSYVILLQKKMKE